MSVIKRLFWLLTGAALGLASSLWVARRARQAVARLAPDRLAGTASEKVRRLGAEVREAAAEGRSAMREREAELRSELQPRL